jgi:hypothetical protein
MFAGHTFICIKLVLCGDFFQLPPVPGFDRDNNTEIPTTFAFNANSWDTCVTNVITLTKVFRQKEQGLVNLITLSRTIPIVFQYLLTCLMTCVSAS